jgi:hypothetical protein
MSRHRDVTVRKKALEKAVGRGAVWTTLGSLGGGGRWNLKRGSV